MIMKRMVRGLLALALSTNGPSDFRHAKRQFFAAPFDARGGGLAMVAGWPAKPLMRQRFVAGQARPSLNWRAFHRVLSCAQGAQDVGFATSSLKSRAAACAAAWDGAR
jgi:hypothetical protein